MINTATGPRGPKTSHSRRHRSEPASFLLRRTQAEVRLVRCGIPADLAIAWIEAWDRSTIDLAAFRSAADFWDVGFRFAVEEYRRGYRPDLS